MRAWSEINGRSRPAARPSRPPLRRAPSRPRAAHPGAPASAHAWWARQCCRARSGMGVWGGRSCGADSGCAWRVDGERRRHKWVGCRSIDGVLRCPQPHDTHNMQCMHTHTHTQTRKSSPPYPRSDRLQPRDGSVLVAQQAPQRQHLLLQRHNVHLLVPPGGHVPPHALQRRLRAGGEGVSM